MPDSTAKSAEKNEILKRNTLKDIVKNIDRELRVTKAFFTDFTGYNMQGQIDDELSAFLIRSPKKSGSLLSVGFSPDLPQEEKEKCLILTSKDIPGRKKTEMLGLETEILCVENVKYEGEPVGLLLGEDESLLRRLLEEDKITVEIEAEESESPNESEEEKTEIERLESKSDGFDPAVFENSTVIEGSWKNAMKATSMKETNGALAVPVDGKILIHTPNQWTANLQKSAAEATGLERGEIFIDRTTITICNTNAIWLGEMAAVQAAVAAKVTGRPVKLLYTRDEQEKFIENVADIQIRHRTVLDENGKILSMDVDIESDIGQATPFHKEIAERLMISAIGIYKPKNFRIASRVVSSRQPPKSVKLAAIAMHTFFAVENQMNLIADKTGISPTALRKINTDTESHLLKDTDLNRAISLVTKDLDLRIREEYKERENDSGWWKSEKKTKDVLSEDFEPTIFDRKYVSYRMKGKYTSLSETIAPYIQNPRGIAITCALEGNGYLKRRTVLKTEKTKEGFFKIDSFAKHAWKKWSRIVNDKLKIDKEAVFLSPTIATSEENNWPDTLCDNVNVKSRLLKKCCELTLEGNAKSQVELESLIGQKEDGRLFDSYSLAVCAMEIGIDPCDMRTTIKKISVAIDCGRVGDEEKARTAVMLEIQKIVAQLETDGKIKCEEIEVNFVESESSGNDDSKQIGHLMHSVIPAAFTSAISLAIGRTIDKLPISKEGIYNACEVQPE